MPKKSVQKPSYQAPALEKGLDILELLAGQEVGLSQQQIATKLRRTPNELFRMLNCLVERGYVTRRPPEELYRLSPKLFVLANQYPPNRRLHEVAMPLLRRLADKAEQSCHLGIPDDGYLLIMAQADAPGFLSYTVRVGMRVPLFETGSGMVLLAFQEASVRDQWLNVLPDSRSSEEHESLLRGLKQVRRRKFLKRPSKHVRGVTDLSAPVFDHTEKAIGAITVPYMAQSRNRCSMEQVLSDVVSTADQLTGQLTAS